MVKGKCANMRPAWFPEVYPCIFFCQSRAVHECVAERPLHLPHDAFSGSSNMYNALPTAGCTDVDQISRRLGNSSANHSCAQKLSSWHSNFWVRQLSLRQRALPKPFRISHCHGFPGNLRSPFALESWEPHGCNTRPHNEKRSKVCCQHFQWGQDAEGLWNDEKPMEPGLEPYEMADQRFSE